MPLVEPDEINEIAILTGCGIDPVADRAAFGFEEADVETAPGCSGDIANHPVAAFAPACGQIMAANGLHVLRKPFR